MALQQLHDVREYQIRSPALSILPAATIIILPIPFSGQVVRMTSVCHVSPDLTTGITLKLNAVSMQINGLEVVHSLSASDLVGEIHVSDYSPTDPLNFCYEGEDGNSNAVNASLSIVSAGQAAVTGTYSFMITIRP